MKFMPHELAQKWVGDQQVQLTYEELVKRLELADAVCEAYSTTLCADRGKQADDADKKLTDTYRQWWMQKEADGNW